MSERSRLSGILPVPRKARNTTVPMHKICLFGDSHAYAIQRAIERRQKKGLAVPLTAHRLLKEKNGILLGDTTFEAFLDLAAGLKPDDIVVSVIGGNQHAVFSTVQHPRPFDFVNPVDPHETFAPGAEVIPYRVLREYFAKGIRGRDGLSLEALRKRTQARVVHCMAPPPKRDNSHILRHHESRFAQDDIVSLGVSSPELRMKFWKLQTDLLVEFCASLNIEVMYPPAEACDQDGFLATEFYANDATHANPSYGELVLQAVETMVQNTNTLRSESL
jgi:hypothetical protein